MRENRTQGSVRGRSGNWLVYLDDRRNAQPIAAGSFVDWKRNCRNELFSPKFLGIDSEPSKSRIDHGNSDFSSHAMVFDRELRTFW